MKLRFLILSLACVLCAQLSEACTSAIVAASATADGRPILWKHRDTSASNNFLYRVEQPGKIGFVGLFNGADELNLDEAWMGMNDAGFAIMNTVAYNLPANEPDWIDREGVVMSMALASCRTVDDFERLLKQLPRPMGVRTNFGVIDAEGNGAYFETDDYNYERFDLKDAANGILIRTNYAYSGIPNEGMGYIRHKNVEDLLDTQLGSRSITPASLTEGLSRSFYNSVTGFNGADSSESWTIDQDFIPRHSSTASIAIEGIKPGENISNMIMWANLGYPPCSHVVPVTLTSIPEEAGPNADSGAYSPAGLDASVRMLEVFPIYRGSGSRYVNLDAVRAISDEQYRISLEKYAAGAKLRVQ